MAEVYLAMREGVGGFEKLVVVKRIFSHFCEDQRFVTMFLDEARLAASISHPNVVEIFDIGEDTDGYFMAMEYLSGETLALIFETLRARQATIPAPIVARIGADVAAGLHYAHSATDGSGTALDIVHRDVTPSNIIVCFNGTTKIVDFGIAKAQLRDSQTRSGALKGKMAYLSPEQIEDTEVDHRTDIFQLGITLHEMLTGMRLFDADGDHQKMMAVMERPILPPSEVNPYVPKVFDDVVLRALQRDVRKRTQSADQLRRELEYALKQLGTTVSDHDVADWMQSTFADRYRERIAMERESVSQMRSGVRTPAGKRQPGRGVVSESGGKTPTLATVVARPTGQSRGDVGGKKRATPMLLVGGAAAGIALGGFLFWKSGGAGAEPKAAAQPEPAARPEAGPETHANPVPSPKRFTVRVRAEPASALISIDGVEIGKGRIAREFAADGRSHRLLVTAPGYESQEITFENAPPVRDDEVIKLTKVEPVPTGAEQAGTGSNTPKATGQTAKPKGPTRPGDGKNASTDSKSGQDGVKSPGKDPPNDGKEADEKDGDDWRNRSDSDNIDPWKR